MSALAEFLFPAPASRNTPAILAWWERRRPAYNAWVGAAGLVSLSAVGLVNALAGGGAMFPQALVMVGVFGVLANVGYCLGPVTEILVEKIWGGGVLPTGPVLYRMGLTFSVGLALFPTLLAVIMATVRVLLAILGIRWA